MQFSASAYDNEFKKGHLRPPVLIFELRSNLVPLREQLSESGPDLNFVIVLEAYYSNEIKASLLHLQFSASAYDNKFKKGHLRPPVLIFELRSNLVPLREQLSESGPDLNFVIVLEAYYSNEIKASHSNIIVFSIQKCYYVKKEGEKYELY